MDKKDTSREEDSTVPVTAVISKAILLYSLGQSVLMDPYIGRLMISEHTFLSLRSNSTRCAPLKKGNT